MTTHYKTEHEWRAAFAQLMAQRTTSGRPDTSASIERKWIQSLADGKHTGERSTAPRCRYGAA